MKKLFNAVHKEWLVLIRDIEGLALLFVMPLILVFIMPLLQDKTYKSVNENNIEVVVINNDNDSVGFAITKGIEQAELFKVEQFSNVSDSAVEEIKSAVSRGRYQIGIYIPKGTTNSLKSKVLSLVQKQIPSISYDNSAGISTIELFFDPITKESFRAIVKSTLNEFYSKLESRTLFITYSKVIDAMTGQISNLEYPDKPAIEIKEMFLSEYKEGKPPNSVQHNVPAWTLFAMFFICIPMAGNVIRERDYGFSERLKTMPVNYFTLLSAKVIVYLAISFLQAVVIVLTGLFLLPLLGLPELSLGHSYLGFISVTLMAGFAASVYGVTLGVFSKTYIQSSVVGSVSVVVFAAIGGVWIPPYVMSETMRKLSFISPMRWGIEGYYEYFIRDSSLVHILPHALNLLLFAMFLILLIFVKRKIWK